MAVYDIRGATYISDADIVQTNICQNKERRPSCESETHLAETGGQLTSLTSGTSWATLSKTGG